MIGESLNRSQKITAKGVKHTNCRRHVFISVLIVMAVAIFLSVAHASNDNPFEGMRTYYEGQYRVGRDFIAGEYVLLNTSEYSGYFAISSDANGRNTIANGLFEVNSIITVYDGEYLNLSRCIAIESTDFYSSYTIKTDRDGTMLKVGYDILPGEYKLIAASGTSGYYSIYNDSRQIDIIDNSLFKNSAWVTVKQGQYIILSRCHIQ